MKKKARHILTIAGCLLIVLVAVGIFAITTNAEPAETTEEIIQKTFEKLEVSDAEYVGQFSYDNGKEGEYILYFSEATGMEYHFRAETGDLFQFMPSVTISGEVRGSEQEQGEPQSESQTEMTEDELREYILDYAANHVPYDLIGELTIETEHDCGVFYIYTIRELYDGMETGSIIHIDCGYDGSILWCYFQEGSIFRKNNNGTYSLINGIDFIGEEAAVEKAHEYFTAVTAEQGRTLSIVEGAETIEMKALEDKLYYLVTVSATDDTDWEWHYYFEIDAYTGEMLSTYYS